MENFVRPIAYIVGGIVLLKITLKTLFPHVLNCIMKTIHSHLVGVKEQLFKEAFKHITTGSERFEILEIGIGTGENFKNFPQNSNVTILDKTDKFMPYLQKSINANKRDDLKVSKLVLNHAENMHSIESNSMDAVVHTFILCSVKNSDTVLSEIHRVLKPGGVCVFIEHSVDTVVNRFFISEAVVFNANIFVSLMTI